jgi:hypothetical protein
MNRVMKFILYGRPLDILYHETTIECFSDKIKAFLAEHSNEVVFVRMNKTTAIRMYKHVRSFFNLRVRYETTPYDSTLKKIIREYKTSTRSYLCIAYIGPTEGQVNEAIKKTVLCEGPVRYVNCHSSLNGYTTKPCLLKEEKK